MFMPIRSLTAISGIILSATMADAAAPPVPVGELQVQPASLVLTHPRRPHSLLVTGRYSPQSPLLNRSEPVAVRVKLIPKAQPAKK